MKPTLLAFLFILTSTVSSLSANAQARTYTPINSSFSSSMYGSGTICTNCELVLAAGVTITINSTCGCVNCTFVGGTVLITTGSNFTLSGVDSFVDESVTLNQQFSDSSLTFYGANVSVTTPITLTGAQTVIDSSTFAIGSSLTLGKTSVAKSTLNLTGSSTLTVNNNLTSSASTYNLASTSSINSTANTNLTGDNINMSGTTNGFTSAYTLTAANTNFKLNGSSGTLTASQGFTASGGSITAASGSTIKSAYTATFSNTAISLTGTTFTASQGFTTSGSTFSASSSTVNGSGGAVSLTNTTTTLTSTSLTGQSLTTSGGIFKATSSPITSTNAISLTNTADTLISANYSGQSISTSGGTLYVNNGSLTSTYAATFVNTQAKLVGNASLTAQQLSLQTNTWFAVGDGTLGSTANISLTYASAEDATSTLAIANNNNYLKSTTTGVGNCSGTYPHACATGYVYGCATLKNNGAPVYCTVLAAASINLSAAVTGPGQVALTWTDNETGNAADHYTIQRNTGNNAWTDISTTAAGSTTGDYYLTDANAPAGNVDYRIQRTDADGNTLYSPVASVNLTLAGSVLSIHPNPAIGGRFYINTPYTGEMVVNVYTSTGQLLFHTSLQGQTQYSIQLPQQNLSMSAVVVQTISQNGNGAFTVLVR